MIHHDKVSFISGMQGWHNIHKSINVIQYVKNIRDKNHIIFSIGAGNAFNQLQHPFMIKALQKLGIEDAFLIIVKAIYDKTIVNIILNGEKLKQFPLNRNKASVSIFPMLIKHSTEIPRQSNKAGETNKIDSNNEEVKLSSFVGDKIFYLKDPKNAIKNLRSHKHVQQTIRIQYQYTKSVVFLPQWNWRKAQSRFCLEARGEGWRG
jgi:hypothetical protein